MIKNLRIIIITALIVQVTDAFALSEQGIKSAVEHGLKSCLQKQRTYTGPYKLTDTQYEEYCRCYLTKIFTITPNEDLIKFNKTKDLSPFMPMLNKATAECSESLKRKWGYYGR
jgi:hypothetical protein